MIKTILYENLSISVIVPVLAEAKINIQPFGVDALLEKTIEIIPEMLQKTLRTIIKHSLFEKRMQSYLVVSAGTGLTAAVTCGYIPYTSLVLYFPLKIISAYIKWNFCYLEINNETLSDAINPNDTSDRYNSEYDDNKSSRDIHYYSESYYDEFQKNYNKKDEDINKLIGIISPIGIKSQSFVKELYINQIFWY